MNAPLGKVILITGASSGIGRELAIQLAAPGIDLWLIGRNEVRLGEVASQVEAAGGTARICTIDLADLDSAGRWLDENARDLERIDDVYLGAAVSLFGEVHNMLLEDWGSIYQTNLLSPLQWADFFFKCMQKRSAGRIIIISSLAAYAGYPTATAYAAMKAGLLGYFKSMRPEAASHGVSFHIAAPGYVETGIYQAATYRNVAREKVLEEIDNLGFDMIPASKAASAILNGVDRGRAEFAFPYYACFMMWLAPRFPWLMGIIHTKLLKNFRNAS